MIGAFLCAIGFIVLMLVSVGGVAYVLFTFADKIEFLEYKVMELKRYMYGR